MNAKLIKFYRYLHLKHPSYGRGFGATSVVRAICESYRLETVLDFGCGKGRLARRLTDSGIETTGYDPSVPGFDVLPNRRFDLVVATDVLEHLDPDSYRADLACVASLAQRAIFVHISCRPAYNFLPDGRNCHTMLMKPSTWKVTLSNVWSDFILAECGYHWIGESVMMLFVRPTAMSGQSDALASTFNLVRRASMATELRALVKDLGFNVRRRSFV